MLNLGLPAEGRVENGEVGDLDFKVDDNRRTAGLATGIVCKRCGQFRAVLAQSREGIRRLCADCLRYRPSDGRIQVWERGFPLPDGE